MMFIGYFRPFALPWMNRLELINEYFLLNCCYFMFTYSDGLLLMDNPGWPEYDEKLPDVDLRFAIGWCTTAILALLIFSNLTVMLAN